MGRKLSGASDCSINTRVSVGMSFRAVQSPLCPALEHREEAGLRFELNRVFDVDLVRFTPCSP